MLRARLRHLGKPVTEARAAHRRAQWEVASVPSLRLCSIIHTQRLASLHSASVRMSEQDGRLGASKAGGGGFCVHAPKTAVSKTIPSLAPGCRGPRSALAWVTGL